MAPFASSETFSLSDRFRRARHFNGVGFGSQALAAYVLGTELAPRKTAPQVKVAWACFSTVGTGATALIMRALIVLPGYNWRMLTLLSIIPIVLLTLVTYFVIDESPRWVLIAKGELPAKALLASTQTTPLLLAIDGICI